MILRQHAFATLSVLLCALILTACTRRGDLSSATLTWIHPELKQSPPSVAITDPAALSRLPSLFPGYDGPPPKAPAYDPPMYDVVLAFNKTDGHHFDIKIYLPRKPLFAGMWRHPGGQLVYFDDAGGEAIVKLVEPYIPKELQ